MVFHCDQNQKKNQIQKWNVIIQKHIHVFTVKCNICNIDSAKHLLH